MAMELGLAVLEEPHLGVQRMPLLLSCCVHGHQPLQGTKGFRKALAQGVPGARTEPLVEQDEEPLRLPGKRVSRARTAHVERELSLSV